MNTEGVEKQHTCERYIILELARQLKDNEIILISGFQEFAPDLDGLLGGGRGGFCRQVPSNAIEDTSAGTVNCSEGESCRLFGVPRFVVLFKVNDFDGLDTGDDSLVQGAKLVGNLRKQLWGGAEA